MIEPMLFHSDEDGDVFAIASGVDGLYVAVNGHAALLPDAEDVPNELLSALLVRQAPAGLFDNDGRSPVDYAMAVSDWISEVIG